MTRSATSVHFLKGFIRGLFIVGNFLLPIFLGAADQTEYTILAEDGAVGTRAVPVRSSNASIAATPCLQSATTGQEQALNHSPSS